MNRIRLGDLLNRRISRGAVGVALFVAILAVMALAPRIPEEWRTSAAIGLAVIGAAAMLYFVLRPRR